MRATGDLSGRPLVLWGAGVLDNLPNVFEHAIVTAARWHGGGALLMKDVGPYLVPEADATLPMEQHTSVPGPHGPASRSLLCLA
jgi:hypothetical protein